MFWKVNLFLIHRALPSAHRPAMEILHSLQYLQLCQQLMSGHKHHLLHCKQTVELPHTHMHTNYTGHLPVIDIPAEISKQLIRKHTRQVNDMTPPWPYPPGLFMRSTSTVKTRWVRLCVHIVCTSASCLFVPFLHVHTINFPHACCVCTNWRCPGQNCSAKRK